MSRIGNSLDNRESEYFFGSLKKECLNKINTKTMKLKEIYNNLKSYISWYNNNIMWRWWIINPTFTSIS
ncbi:hypothetical protein EELLY_v1c04230 [Entomoplasma ellychniae]|uniref:Integrase catalytic domain-containing protein n=1 Tax=Entomoplasma ellychniae TaxID=2114 RepID=A0A8E2UE50_9MOLU|nr:IS3 family transposase [Entomoplasma ellychniae]PPE04743.1 hypothetical protein EELLY_v1c04230 [Entomoplasma ellychniae]